MKSAETPTVFLGEKNINLDLDYFIVPLPYIKWKCIFGSENKTDRHDKHDKIFTKLLQYCHAVAS